MRYFNLSILLIFIYEIVSLSIDNYKVNRNGGKRVEVFKNNSFLQKSFLIFLPIGTIINVMTVLKFSGILNFVLLQLYIMSKVLRVMKDIYIYENGILYFGRFIKWQDIAVVKLVENQGIKIELESSYKAIILDNVEREKDLIEILKSNYHN